MWSEINYIMRTKCPTDMEEATLERKFHMLLLYSKKTKQKQKKKKKKKKKRKKKKTYAQFSLLFPKCLLNI